MAFLKKSTKESCRSRTRAHTRSNSASSLTSTSSISRSRSTSPIFVVSDSTRRSTSKTRKTTRKTTTSTPKRKSKTRIKVASQKHETKKYVVRADRNDTDSEKSNDDDHDDDNTNNNNDSNGNGDDDDDDDDDYRHNKTNSQDKRGKIKDMGYKKPILQKTKSTTKSSAKRNENTPRTEEEKKKHDVPLPPPLLTTTIKLLKTATTSTTATTAIVKKKESHPTDRALVPNTNMSETKKHVYVTTATPPTWLQQTLDLIAEKLPIHVDPITGVRTLVSRSTNKTKVVPYLKMRSPGVTFSNAQPLYTMDYWNAEYADFKRKTRQRRRKHGRGGGGGDSQDSDDNDEDTREFKFELEDEERGAIPSLVPLPPYLECFEVANCGARGNCLFLAVGKLLREAFIRYNPENTEVAALRAAVASKIDTSNIDSLLKNEVSMRACDRYQGGNQQHYAWSVTKIQHLKSASDRVRALQEVVRTDGNRYWGDVSSLHLLCRASQFRSMRLGFLILQHTGAVHAELVSNWYGPGDPTSGTRNLLILYNQRLHWSAVTFYTYADVMLRNKAIFSETDRDLYFGGWRTAIPLPEHSKDVPLPLVTLIYASYGKIWPQMLGYRS